MLHEVAIPRVNCYCARSNYWAGEILKGIAGGESLYLEDSMPWGFHFRFEADRPHSVVFANGKVWSFLCSKRAMLLWPLFFEDLQKHTVFRGSTEAIRASVTNIYSDSMRVDLFSEHACLLDLLLWQYPCEALS